MLVSDLGDHAGTSLYVANDGIANFWFHREDSGFVERAFTAGMAVDDSGVANASMGIALLDFNLDQRFDIFVTNFEHEMMGLYINLDGHSFRHQSRQAGLNHNDLQVVAFGVAACDFDSDGDEDVVYTAGHVHYHPDRGSMQQLPGLLQNNAGRSFSRIDLECEFFTQASVGRGLATADIDNDGDMDLIATQLLGSPTLVRNLQQSGHWITLELVGRSAPRTPIGATVELSVGGSVLVRQLYGGGSYLSQSQQRLHFAWPSAWAANSSDAQVASVKVSWPDGTQSETLSVPIDQHSVIVQAVRTP